ncbi:MAG: hypothetical protein ABI389_00765 [Rhodanobacter sp.]
MTANSSPIVKLDIRRAASTGDGWIDVMGSNNEMYSYKYEGGNHPTRNDGSIQHIVNAGKATITLNLIAASVYRFGEIHFSGDDANQLTSAGNRENQRLITNECTAKIDAHYKVWVTDTGRLDAGDCPVVLLCDPAIKNVKE